MLESQNRANIQTLEPRIPESPPPAAHAAAVLLSAEPCADADAPLAKTMPMYDDRGYIRYSVAVMWWDVDSLGLPGMSNSRAGL